MRKVFSSILTGGLTLFGLAAVTFFIGRKIPIDPVLSVVGDAASPETYEKARMAMGLPLPLYEQFWLYLKNLLQGDLGHSFLTSQPVLDDLKRVFSATIELATLSLLLGAGGGIFLGIFGAQHQGKWQDKVVGVLSLVGYSVPVFWLGLLLLLVFYSALEWAPGPGRLDIIYHSYQSTSGFILFESLLRGDWDVFMDAAHHLMLPVCLLGYYNMAYIARMTRSLVLGEMKKQYVLTARIKRLSNKEILWRHVLPNIRVPLVSVVALSYGGLLEGSVLTETVFSWPGLGLYLVNSLMNVDMNAVLGATLLTGAIFVTIHTLVDMFGHVMDPRAKERHG